MEASCLKWNEVSSIRGYVHMGVPVEQIIEMTGFLNWQIQEIIDELKKELEDGCKTNVAGLDRKRKNG